MKASIRKLLPALASLLTLTAPFSQAAPFVQGSAINIPAGSTLVLDMRQDDIFRCSTVSIAPGASLVFQVNALNTPVFLVATGDVRIEGRIFVDGASGVNGLGGYGGPGGYPGGMGGIAGGHTVAGHGAGPGGGKNASGWFGGVFGFPRSANSNVYGNALLYPMIGGSGGAGTDAAAASGYGGGGGGGAILVASDTRIEISASPWPYDGGIYARGGIGGGPGRIAGGGSGGAIRLVAPVVSGTGYLDTTGGEGGGCCPYLETGSHGRVRIDCLDDFSYRGLIARGSFTRGSQMFVFRTNAPRIDVVEAAGEIIPLGITNAVTVSLPFGSPTNHIVKIRAENFTNSVPIRIAVTPDTGPSRMFGGVIANAFAPATNAFHVEIPAGTVSRIDAWTR